LFDTQSEILLTDSVFLASTVKGNEMGLHLLVVCVRRVRVCGVFGPQSLWLCVTM
jgi:hypothetical protein